MKKKVQTPAGKRKPDFKHLTFVLNTETGYYNMERGELGFSKVPAELKLEITQCPQQIKSGAILRSRQVLNKRQFFTGLLKAGFEGWYFGDYFEVRNGIKKKSFILFRFAPDNLRFDMYFFNLIMIYPDHREKFISDFLDSLKKINGADCSNPVHCSNLSDRQKSVRNDKDSQKQEQSQ